MKRLTLFIAAACLLCIYSPVQAQTQERNVDARDYNVGIGLRLGGFISGISVKGFVGPKGALEGIAGFGSRSLTLTGLYEHHFPIAKAPGLNLYAGGGGHIGFFSHRSRYWIYKNKNEHVYVVDEGETAVIPGADGVFGIEYKFQGAPFTVGADIKPFLDFYDGVSHYVDGAVNLRWVF